MAKNNWADDAFKKAQNLMSRGYGDFQPTTVVTQDQLSDLGDVITTSRPLLSDNQIANDNANQPANEWYKFPDENIAETTAIEEVTPIESVLDKEFNLDTVEQDAIDLEAKNAIRNRDPERAQSAWDKFAAPDDLTEQEYTKKQSKMAIQMIEKELKKVRYNSFTKMTPGEKEKRDARILELEREQKRLMEKYRARDWSQESRNEEGRQIGDRAKQAWDEESADLDKRYEDNEFGEVENKVGKLVGDNFKATDGFADGDTTDIKDFYKKAQGKVKEYINKGIKWVQDEAGNKKILSSQKNNPGNIEKTDIEWAGEGKDTYNNGRFTTFEDPQAGIDAMTKDLTTKLKRHDGDLKKMIENYASSKDGNDVKKYLQVVQKTAGKKYKYTMDDIENIVKGFIRMENKKPLADYYINIMEK